MSDSTRNIPNSQPFVTQNLQHTHTPSYKRSQPASEFIDWKETNGVPQKVVYARS